jgi:TRAP-type C4-dicarboxylate transport system substrate-binding protein
MKRMLGSILLLAGLACGLAAPANAQTVLRYNRWLPVEHHLEKNVFIPWMQKVAEVTQGRVRIEPTSSSLGSILKQYDMVTTGVADVVFTAESYSPGLFPLAEMLTVPFIGTDVEKLSVAYWQVYEKHFAQANPYPKVHLLALTAFPPYHFFNSKRAISLPEHVKGLKLVSSGQFRTDFLGKMGATVVSAGLTQLVEMISNGTVDGTFVTDDAIKSFGVVRVVKHRTEFPGGLGTASSFIAMNEQKWLAISERDRAAISAISGLALARQMGASLKAADGLARDEIAKAGIPTVVASGSLLSSAREAAAPIEAQWIAMAKEKNVDGAAALRMLRDLAK